MSRGEGRYSRVSRRIWNDAGFRKLSAPKPNAQTLLFRLLTGPELGCIPGLFPMREAGLAEALGWPLKSFKKCFAEVISEGIARFNHEAGLCWLPKAIFHNEPANPNVVKGWETAWTEIPECSLKDEAKAYLLAWAKARGKSWEDALRKAFGNPSPEGSAKEHRKQDQDQDQEQDPSSSVLPKADPVQAKQEPENDNETARVPKPTESPLTIADVERLEVDMMGAMPREFVDVAVGDWLRKPENPNKRLFRHEWRSYAMQVVVSAWRNDRRRREILAAIDGTGGTVPAAVLTP